MFRDKEQNAVESPIESTPATQSAPPSAEHGRVEPAKIKNTWLSGTWLAILIAVVLGILLLIFILQNLSSITVHYLGASGSLPIGVALLLSAVGGALLVALVGTARILQLRRVAKVAKRRGQS